MTLGASGATEPAHARNVAPLRQGKRTRVELPVARMCVRIAMYFAAKYIGSSHIRSLSSQRTTDSMPVCSTLKDQAITRNKLSCPTSCKR